MASFGGLVMRKDAFGIFPLFFSLMYQDVLNRGLREVTD